MFRLFKPSGVFGSVQNLCFGHLKSSSLWTTAPVLTSCTGGNDDDKDATPRTHADLKWPDFCDDRRSSVQDETMAVTESSYTRKVLSTLPMAVALTAGIYGTKTVVEQLVGSMAPAKDVLAMAQAEVKITGIPVGSMATVKWRGKPLFIKHRAEADVLAERQTPMSALRDPERDEDRVIKSEWLVVIGVCTHLGCVPISNAGDFNAFYCPCHGSHYDHSGRVRKGPAPTNLEVPKYVFVTDELLLVG